MIPVNSKHRKFRKNFETEMIVDGQKIALNHFIQETLANIVVSFLKTLKDADKPANMIQIQIKKLDKTVVVDSHTYPKP